jgi:F-type H+-transporting ATPase subunit b
MITSLPILLGSALTQINPGLVIWTLVTFALLLMLLKKFAWGPILGMVEEREKGIREALDAAGKQREEAQRMIEEHQAALETARKESAEMVRKTQEEVEKARTEAIEKARSEAEDMIATARRQIEAEQKKAFVEVRAAAVDLAIAAASRLVEVSMDEAKQRSLVEDYLKELERKPAA